MFAPAPAPAPARQPKPAIGQEDRFEQERAALLTKIALVEKQVEDQRMAAALAVDEARREGHATGMAQAEDREAARFSLLSDALATETAALGDRLSRVEGVALTLARAALAKIFDTPGNMDAMVISTLAKHVAMLADQAILVVGVSKADFADVGQIRTMTAALGTHGQRARIDIDPELPSGACRLTYRIGQIDLDVPRQWAALSSLLDEMASS